jgi:hypothetical protein
MVISADVLARSAPLLGPNARRQNVQQENCVMKFQQDPSRERMIALSSGASQVAIDEISCNGIDRGDRRHVETVRSELASIVCSGDHSGVSEEAPELDEVAVRIGTALRELNSGGLYLCAESQLDGPISLVAADGEDRRTHTVLIRAIAAQRAAA